MEGAGRYHDQRGWALGKQQRTQPLDADREDWRNRAPKTAIVPVARLSDGANNVATHRFVRFSVRPQNTVLALWFLREQKNFWLGPTNACQDQPL